MANNIKICPFCGNYVEGKRKQSYGKDMAKTGAKDAAGGVIGFGGAGAGAAAGAVFGPIGALVGAGVGYLAGIAGKTALNKTVDHTVDAVTGVDYEYICPKCGRTFEESSASSIYTSTNMNVEQRVKSTIARICNKSEDQIWDSTTLKYLGISNSLIPNLTKELSREFSITLSFCDFTENTEVRKVIYVIRTKLEK